MISFREYQTFLEKLRDEDIVSCRIDSLDPDSSASGKLFLKHDVEARMDRAVKMSRIEAASGHLATYYVQGDLLSRPGASEHLQEISSMGHEIAYHYDVLDANEGNFDAALEEFENYLRLFEALGHSISTVCPHGNPTKLRNGWNSNKDFFRSARVRRKFPQILDIVVDFPILFHRGVYISDAGRALRIVGSISENDSSNTAAMNDGVEIGWSEVSDLARKRAGVVLSVHPHRFYLNPLVHKAELAAFVLLKKAYLKLEKIPAVKHISDKHYKLARRF